MSAITAASSATKAEQAAKTAAETKKRRALHAYLSDGAHESWHQFAANNGVSVSATLEALASELDDEAGPKDGSAIDFAPIVRRARQTDADRRRRRH